MVCENMTFHITLDFKCIILNFLHFCVRHKPGPTPPSPQDFWNFWGTLPQACFLGHYLCHNSPKNRESVQKLSDLVPFLKVSKHFWIWSLFYQKFQNCWGTKSAPFFNQIGTPPLSYGKYPK